MFRGKLHLSARPKPAWVLLVGLAACTDPAQRAEPLRVSIDADTIVRLNTVRVEIRLEAQLEGEGNHPSKTWDPLIQQTFRPDPMLDTDWPWERTLDSKDSTYTRYNLTAIARDPTDSIVGRVQLVRDLAQARRSGLRVRFDSACYRPKSACGEGSTCTGGKCVDAATMAASPEADGGTGEPTGQEPRITTHDLDGIAMEGASCRDTERACSGAGTRKPLACEGGIWRPQPECGENQRCNTADGPDRGMCQVISDQCKNREANVPYCDGEIMRVCVDLVVSDTRTCGTNEQCMPEGTKARCACRTGFVKDNSGVCVRPTECGMSGGGCDLLTMCSMVNGQPACSACPLGYSGSGEKGCAPLLQNVTLSAGTLEPSFDPNTHEYKANVPFLAQRVQLTPTMPSMSTITLNGAKLDGSGSWTSPVLELGKSSSIELVVASPSGVSNKYTIALERTGEQRSYVKPTSSGSYDQFGSAIDISGDTLVVGAWFQDAGATDNGAAYVLVRDGDSWKRQQELKPSDVADYDYFGSAAELDGDTIVIGALHEGLFEADSGASRLGAAYVYTRNGTTWSQTQRLSGTQAERSDLFGAAAVLAGDTLIVGAPWESTGAAHSGAVYVYQRSGGMFSEVQKLKSSKPTANARFGWSLALDGDRLVVGAPDDPPPHNRPGSAEVFVHRNGSWTLSAFLQPKTLSGAASFGFRVAVHGDRVAISAPRTSAYPGSPTPTAPGEVYLFGPDGDGWKQTGMVQARKPRDTDWFGLALMLTDGGLIVGAPGDVSGARGLSADPARTDAIFSGAVYMFAPTDQGWTESTFFKGDNTDTNDWFGYALASDGQSLVVSAMFENGSAHMPGGSLTTGALYVFQ